MLELMGMEMDEDESLICHQPTSGLLKVHAGSGLARMYGYVRKKGVRV